MYDALFKTIIFTPGRKRWGLPVLFWGEPGAAKTDIIEGVCDHYGMPFETLSPSERGEGAFGVVPVPTVPHDRFTTQRTAMVAKLMKETNSDAAWSAAIEKFPLPEQVMTYPPPEWVSKFIQAGKGVIFVDEVTSTPPGLQSPVMGLVRAGRIGGHQFGPRVRCVGACNPPEIAAGGYELSAPLANRFGHITWEPPTVAQHTQYMLRGSSDFAAVKEFLRDQAEDAADIPDEVEETFDVESEEARVMKLWPSAWARAVGLETSFLNANSRTKNAMPKASSGQLGRAWPSDRTWEYAARAYASSIVHALSPDEQELLVSSFIGPGAAKEFFAFIVEQNLPSAEDVLDGKVSFKHDFTRLDRTFAIFQTCSAFVMDQTIKKRAERIESFWGILHKFVSADSDLDIAVPTVAALMTAKVNPSSGSKLLSRTLTKLHALMQKAGAF